MEFCNLLGSNVPTEMMRKLGKNTGLPLTLDVKDALSESYGVASNVLVCSDGKKVTIRCAKDGENTGDVHSNLFALDGDPHEELMPFHKRKNETPIYWSEVQETSENPAIIVMCKAIHLINDVKTYMKILNVNKDCIIAMLVAGAVGFETCDGDVLPMTRCCPSISVNMRKSKRMSPEEFNTMFMLRDKNGYDYNMDMSISAYAYFGNEMVSIKTIKDDCIIFDPNAEGRSNALAEAAEKKRLAAEERKKQEEAERERDREYQAKCDKERAETERMKKEAKAKAAAKTAPKSTKPKMTEIKTEDGSARSTGAEFFLSMLKNS